LSLALPLHAKAYQKYSECVRTHIVLPSCVAHVPGGLAATAGRELAAARREDGWLCCQRLMRCRGTGPRGSEATRGLRGLGCKHTSWEAAPSPSTRSSSDSRYKLIYDSCTAFLHRERGRTQRHTVQDSGEDATTPLPGSKAAAAHATVFVSFTASSRTRCVCTMAVAP
jgi:hypothetical protein